MTTNRSSAGRLGALRTVAEMGGLALDEFLETTEAYDFELAVTPWRRRCRHALRAAARTLG